MSTADRSTRGEEPAAPDGDPAARAVDRAVEHRQGRVRVQAKVKVQFEDLDGVVRALAAEVRDRPPSAGATRLVAVDGLSGSGKTTVGDALAQALDAPILHFDDLYEGWDGLAGAAGLVREWIVAPLRAGQAPRWRPYDWSTGRRHPWQSLPASSILILEGCGAGARELAGDLALLIWVSAARREREARLRARPDWPGYAVHRDGWVRQERAMLRRERTAARADLSVCTDGPPVIRRRAGTADSAVAVPQSVLPSPLPERISPR